MTTAENTLESVAKNFHNLTQAARAAGLNPTAYLRQEYGGVDKDTGLDPFERILAANEIAVRSDPSGGVYSSKVEEVMKKIPDQASARSLVAEIANRFYRSVSSDGRSLPKTSQRAPIYTTADYPVNSWMNPYYDDMTIREDIRIQPQIPLNELVAITTPINSQNVRQFILENDTDEQHLAKVNEGTEIPRMKLRGSERTLKLRKYGRSMEVTYEDLLEMRFDFLAYTVRKLAITAEADKVVAAMNVIINGDGNANTAATNYNLTTLDSGTTANNLTLKAWLKFKMQYKNPYQLTTVLGQEDGILKVWLLDTGNANIPLVTIQNSLGLGSVTPINTGTGDGVRVGWLSEAPANKLVGFDRYNSLQRWIYPAMSISEMDRFITNQTQVMTFTEMEAFGILDPNANKILTLNA